jgi:hypothetical protein
MKPRILLLLLLSFGLLPAFGQERKPASEAELRRWLENMVVYHRFSATEVQAATGLNADEIRRALERHGLSPSEPPNREPGSPLLVLPYPGGRHPRIGFLDGAVDPQRDTKLSIFSPWDSHSHVVADVPEALWSNLGLTYLAHTHVPTIWTEKKVALEPVEWTVLPGGDLRMERLLPNGIRFGTQAHATPEAVLMKMWISNGADRALSDLRVQNCVMLKGMAGFNQQTNANKVLWGPYAACSSENADRWVITAWKPVNRAWANPSVPCIHADPRIPDTKPGEISVIRGLVSFYSGRDIRTEFERIEQNWDRWMRELK